MGNSLSIIPTSSLSTFMYKNINFEDMQTVVNSNDNTIIINTLDINAQNCLIAGTISIDAETKLMNEQLEKNKIVRIVIYGMNSNDVSIVKKYEQLLGLGFSNVFIYLGGLFEWLLLQDIYGHQLFPTTAIEHDLLKYKGRQQFNIRMIKNN
jgi:hypothetical protein